MDAEDSLTRLRALVAEVIRVLDRQGSPDYPQAVGLSVLTVAALSATTAVLEDASESAAAPRSVWLHELRGLVTTMAAGAQILKELPVGDAVRRRRAQDVIEQHARLLERRLAERLG